MKKVAIVFGVFIGVILLVLLALEYVVDLNSYTPKITAPMEDALHRKVELGNISLSLLRGPGAKVQDITIFEQDRSNLFVQVKGIVARVKLLPLLSKKVEVAKILLNKPVVTIKRDREGVWNFGDLLGKTAEASPQVPEEPATSETPVPEATPQETSETPETPGEPSVSQPSEEEPSPMSQFAVDMFQLTNGTVRFVDELMDVTTEVSAITGDVKGIAVESPIRFQISADVDGGDQGKIKASGEIGPIPADGNIDNLELDVTAKLEEIDLAHFSPYYQQRAALSPEKLNASIQLAGNLGKQLASTTNISVGDVKVDVSGTVEEVKTGPKVDLTISLPDLSWEKLLEILPPELAEQMKDLGLSGMGNIKIQPKGSLDDLAISGEFDLSKSGIQYQRLFAKPEAMTMALTFETVIKSMNSVDLSSLKLTLGDFTLNVSGTVTDFAAPVLDLQVSSNEFPLEKLFALFPEIAEAKLPDSDKKLLESGGTGALKASAKGPIDDLVLQLVVNLDNSKLIYGDMFHKDLQSPGNLTIEALLGKDSVSIGKILLQLGNFQLTTAGKIENFAQPQLDLTIDTNLFDIANLIDHLPVAKASLPPELKLGGAGKLHIAPVGSLDDLTVSGSVDMSKGEIVFGELFTKPKDMPGFIEFDTTLKEMDTVEIRRVRLNLNDVLLDITGFISNLKQEAMLDLKVKSNKFALNQLRPMSGMMIESAGTTELDLAIKTSLANIDLASLVTGTLRLSDVGVSLPQLSKPVQHLNALVKIEGDDLEISKFSVAVGESSLKGNTIIKKLFSAPNIAFDLHAPYLNVDDFMAPEETAVKGTRSSELIVDVRSLQTPIPDSQPFLLVASKKKDEPIPTSKSPPATEEAEFLQKIAVNGKIKVDRGQAQNINFADLSADVKMQKGVLNVEPLFFSLYDGKYQGLVKLDLNSPDPKYEFQSKLVHVDTNPMLADSASLDDVVYGLLFADASIRGQGFTTEKIVETLSGKGAFKVEQGKLTTFDIWSKLASMFELLGSVGKAKELTRIGKDLSKFPNETQFSRLEGSFDLKNGSAGSSDMILEIPEQDMHMALMLDGKFGLDTTLDFIGKVRFAPESKYYKDIEKNFRDFKQADGSIELPFPIPIGGTLMEPEISMQSAQKSITAFAKEMAKQAVKGQVKKEVLKLLGGKSSEKDPEPSPEAEQTPIPEAEQTPAVQPTPTPTPKPEKVIEEVGKDLLKGLFKKKKKKK